MTGPTSEPITLAEARVQCNLSHALDDARLAALILDAREWAQGYTRRAFIAQTWDYSVHAFPETIRLPLGPVQSVTSVKYYDLANAEQTLSASYYVADLAAKAPEIYLADGYTWPDTYDRPNAVTVRFVAGYADHHPDLHTVRQAMLLHLEAHYDRDPATFDLLMGAAERKLDALRVVGF